MIDFDVILNKIGPLGRYQILLVALGYWLAIPSAMHNIASVFYTANVDFRCNAPPLDNETLYPDMTREDIYNYTTPYVDGKADGCRRYGYDLSTCSPPSLDCVDQSAAPITCDHGYHYYYDTFTSTTNTEWDLVCDRSILSTIATSIFFAGMWTGAIVFGYLTDRIGRRYTMLIASVGSAVAGVGTGLAPWFGLFVALRFVTAAFSHAGYIFMFVYVVEITGPKATITGVHSHTAFAVGYTLNSLVAYYLRDWRAFYIAISLTTVPYFIIHFFMPESPRWLFSKGRNAEGKKIGEYFAKRNGKILTEADWDEATIGEKSTAEVVNIRSYSSVDLFKPKRMRWIIINMMFCWFATSLVYYGLSLNAGNISGDIFLNNAANGCIEIIAYFFVVFAIDRLGRRNLLCSMFVFCGCSCLLSTVLNELADGNEAMKTTATIFSFIGKAGVSACFAIVYNYCAELFPTVVRGNALGVSSMASRWGSIISPYIIYLQDTVSWLPFTIFGTVALIAGVCAFFLPETTGMTMTQTIEEAEMFYAEQNYKKDDDDMESASSSEVGKSNEAYEQSEESSISTPL